MARAGMKTYSRAVFIIALMLMGCTRPEDDSFGIQAARRGEDCSAIATGSAMDAYAHGVGPVEEVYKGVQSECQEFYRKKAERMDAAKQR